MPNHSRTAGSSDSGGCSFLNSAGNTAVFTPEDFSEDQLLIRDTAVRFVQDEIVPEQQNIELQDWNLTTRLLRRYADLGFGGIEIPERYGGAGLDRVTAMIVAEEMARVSSFSMSSGAQSGLGTLPLLYFGTEELRNKYLPSICTAEILTAYALSEAGSGSDALAAKTNAVLSADGRHWILNGEKMWVSSAAFADLFITFAQVDGKHFSCFVVEKSFPGVSTGAEERKMGLKGSSTRPVVLVDVPVPVGNLLGEVGKGHEVAFNILNIGRTRLGASAVGASKTALKEAIEYARQRTAFGQSISSFGAIQHKLAEMAIRIWITEGMVYRTADLMEQSIRGVDIDDRSRVLAALKEYAVECSIVKVFGSETLGYVVDEEVQIYGGYGFSSEYLAERHYRDARVNRIFEGTNEINRLMISRMLLKKFPGAGSSKPEIDSEFGLVVQAKEVFHLIASAAAHRQDEQEIQLLLADIAIEIYAMDTAVLRARKIADTRGSSEIVNAVVRTYLNDAMSRISFSARQVMAAVATSIQTQLPGLSSLLHWTPVDTISTRRLIAKRVLEAGCYDISR